MPRRAESTAITFAVLISHVLDSTLLITNYCSVRGPGIPLSYWTKRGRKSPTLRHNVYTDDLTWPWVVDTRNASYVNRACPAGSEGTLETEGKRTYKLVILFCDWCLPNTNVPQPLTEQMHFSEPSPIYSLFRYMNWRLMCILVVARPFSRQTNW